MRCLGAFSTTSHERQQRGCNWPRLRPKRTCSGQTAARYVCALEALQSCDSDATKKNTSVSTEAGIGAKENFSPKPGTHAHQTNTLREMTQLVRQPTVGGTSAPRLGHDGRDGCRMRDAEWMKPAEASYLQAGQSISTIVSSPRDVSRSKIATRSSAHHGHNAKHLHGHGFSAPAGLDCLDHRHVV